MKTQKTLTIVLLGGVVFGNIHIGHTEPQDKIIFQRHHSHIRGGELYTMQPDGSQQTRIVKEFDGSSFAINSTAKSVVFSSNRDHAWLNELFIMSLQNLKPKLITDKLTHAYNPAFSPDSKKVAVMAGYSDPHGPGHRFSIYLVNVAASQVRQLTQGPEDWNPAFSPDGQKIVYASGPLAFPTQGYPQKRDLFVINTSGSGKTRLTQTPEDESQPVYSPDGKYIAFVRDGDIYRMKADGTENTQLTAHSASDSAPCFSPNGRQIAFVSNRDGNDEIYVMNADGSQQKRLTNNPAPDRNPAWR